jgi:hypothetical protein
MDNLSAGNGSLPLDRVENVPTGCPASLSNVQNQDSDIPSTVPDGRENWMASRRNRWMLSIGITGWLEAESVDGFNRNRWMTCPGIRRLAAIDVGECAETVNLQLEEEVVGIELAGCGGRGAWDGGFA